MIRSGETVDLAARLGRRVVDKHSTGGVGDKITIAVGPVVAACGVPFGKMSGRGLGHTGGTLDKLESIPGFRVELTTDELVEQTRAIGIAVAGQSAEPRPGRQEALRAARRDRDGRRGLAHRGEHHVEEDRRRRECARPRRARSARARSCGRSRRRESSPRRCASSARRPGWMSSASCRTWISRSAARSATRVEVREAVETIGGGGPPDFRELVVDACGQLLALSDLGVDEEEGRRRAEAAMADGSALAKYEEWIRAQGGDPDLGSPAGRLRSLSPVRAPESGFVRELAGAGGGVRGARARRGAAPSAGDPIDHAVGVVCLKKRGDEVEAGDPLAEIHARDEAAADAARDGAPRGVRDRRRRPEPRPLVLDVIR